VTAEEERETDGQAISSEVITGHTAACPFNAVPSWRQHSLRPPCSRPRPRRAPNRKTNWKKSRSCSTGALPTFAGFYLARQMGAFERRGLDVTFAETQGALSSAAMIGEGKQHWIGSSSGIATAIGRSKGQPIKSLAVYYQKTPTVIFTRTEDHIAHPRDLYGKTLGLVPGSITNEEFRAMLAANKLDRGKVKETSVE